MKVMITIEKKRKLRQNRRLSILFSAVFWLVKEVAKITSYELGEKPISPVSGQIMI